MELISLVEIINVGPSGLSVSLYLTSVPETSKILASIFLASLVTMMSCAKLITDKATSKIVDKIFFIFFLLVPNQTKLTVFIILTAKIHFFQLYRVSRSRWRSARGRVGVNGSCTLSNKIFQNSRRSIRGIAKCCFVHFLHFATFFPETATFQSKNVTFIILIFSELNIIGS